MNDRTLEIKIYFRPTEIETVAIVLLQPQKQDGKCCIRVLSGRMSGEQYCDRDFYHSLVEFRRDLEKIGARALCNGSRIDAVVSGMTLDMAQGCRVYIAEIGRHVRRNDLIDTFGNAPADKIGTISEQREFYKKWRESLPDWRAGLSEAEKGK